MKCVGVSGITKKKEKEWCSPSHQLKHRYLLGMFAALQTDGIFKEPHVVNPLLLLKLSYTQPQEWDSNY